MSFDSFDVYFNGEILPGQDPAAVRQRLAELFKLDERGVGKLFAGAPVKIKQQVDVEKAGKYRERFRRAGALVQIVPQGQPCPPPAQRPAAVDEVPPVAARTTASATDNARAETDGAFELMPAGTGSLADCAAPATQFAEPDLSDMSLAQPGSTIGEEKPGIAREIDVSALSMAEPRSGSLEDCAAETPAQPIPDISAIDLDEVGVQLDDSPPPPQVDIDTGGLEAAPPNSGSLEDCRSDKPPAPVPDISDLRLVDD